MYYLFVLVGLVFIVNEAVNSNEDRYYFESILRVLWRYPIIKQTLIRLCNRELDRCKNRRILRSYTNIIDDDNLQETLNNLIDCFIDSQTCLQSDDWQQWSKWSSCSVTCGMGRTVRIRSCKPHRQCLIGSLSSQSISCFSNSCTSNYRKKLNMIENNIMTHSTDYKSTKNNLNIIFIFLFPFIFTLICIPLCVLYYIYELDFKIHALTIQILSKCQRRDETKEKRINIS